jgi:hypothetical protein
MKKNYLLLLLLVGGAAVYFATRPKKKRRGLVSVESPEKITEKQFESKQPSDVRDLRALAGVNLF